jgi:CHAT domain-containing protein
MKFKHYLSSLILFICFQVCADYLMGQQFEQKLTEQLKEYNLNFGSMMRYRGMEFYAEDPNMDNLIRVLEEFDTKTGILFYHFKNDTLFTWLINKGGTKELKYGFWKGSEHRLAELETEFRALIKSRVNGVLRGAEAENMRKQEVDARMVLDSLNEALFPKAIRKEMEKLDKLLLIPALNISTIPLYLLDPHLSGRMLIEDYTISVVHGMQHLFDMQWKNGAYRRLDKVEYDLIGYTDFSQCDRLNDLPGVEKELHAAKDRINKVDQLLIEGLRESGIRYRPLRVSLHLNADSIRTRIDGRTAHESGSRVLYLATHAVSNPGNPLDSNFFLTYSCDHVTGREIQSMDHSDLLLVIFSACQTAQGKTMNTGTLSVGRAFLKGNAQNVVSSLWSVDDEATAQFMELFMEELTPFYLDSSVMFNGKVGFDMVFYPAYQLRQAMLKFKKIDPDPNHWAAFISTGSPLRGFLLE